MIVYEYLSNTFRPCETLENRLLHPLLASSRRESKDIYKYTRTVQFFINNIRASNKENGFFFSVRYHRARGVW